MEGVQNCLIVRLFLLTKTEVLIPAGWWVLKIFYDGIDSGQTR